MGHGLALITGASSGIGAAFARLLPRTTGLLLSGRDEARLAALRDELAAEGRTVETLTADLATEAGRAALIEGCWERPVDLLINNAGFGRYGAFTENPAEVEAEMVLVNCLAPVAVTRALLPGMVERARASGRRAGLIVVASTAAFFPLPRLATYTATKAFDLSFAESLAGELAGEPVDVLALCPGATRTAFFERAGMDGAGSTLTAAPEKVAREGLAALGRRPVHIVGAANRLAAAAARRMPRTLVRAGASRAMTRLSGKD